MHFHFQSMDTFSFLDTEGRVSWIHFHFQSLDTFSILDTKRRVSVDAFSFLDTKPFRDAKSKGEVFPCVMCAQVGTNSHLHQYNYEKPPTNVSTTESLFSFWRGH